MTATSMRPSLLDSLDPRSRVLATVAFALVVVGLSDLMVLGLALALGALAAMAARLPAAATARRLLAFEGFMVLAIGLLPFTIPGAAAFDLFGLTGSWAGLERASVILLKANAVMLALLALMGPVDGAELGHALGRLGVPDKLVQILLFTLRYLEVTRREYRRLRTAMRARAFSMRRGRHSWRAVGHLVGMLMVRSVERAERILAAMRCRGFDGRFPAFRAPRRFRRADGLFAAAAVIALVLLVVAEVAA